MDNKRKTFGFGLLLIFIGIVFVANTFGYYTNCIWALPVIFQGLYVLIKYKKLNALFAIIIGLCVIVNQLQIVKGDLILGALILTAGVVVMLGAIPEKKADADLDHDGYIDDAKPSKNNNRKKNKNTYNEDEFDSYISKHDNKDEFDSYISK